MAPLVIVALVAGGSLSPVPREALCVTTGAIETRDHHLLIEASEVRAVAAAGRARTVEARVRYLGPSVTTTPLASGEIRRQFGLKLRAANTCNVVYVMWHVEPDAQVAVSVKSNPGMTTHAQCDAHGYRTPRPRRRAEPPPLRPGLSRVLRADLDGSELTVRVDGVVVWQGDLGPEALAFDGPVGVRSDNGSFEFDLFEADSGSGPTLREGACRAEPGSE
jgi:hypothetical protein